MLPYRPIAVDLFAGAGGLSLGLEQAGFDVVSSLEYDPVHAATHARNFPTTDVLCGDASKVSEVDLRASVARGWEARHPGVQWDGSVDLVAGGPPCQGFSWIGKRQVEDSRNDLVFHFFRLVKALRPRYFMMENVPGMGSGAHKVLLDDLIAHFEGEGYSVAAPAILNAAHYGVPQDRKRLILLGSMVGMSPATHPTPRFHPVRPVRAGVSSDTDDLPVGPTVRDAICGLPDLDAYRALLESDSVRLNEADQGARREESTYGKRLAGVVLDPEDLSYPRAWSREFLTSSMRTVHTEKSVMRFESTAPGTVEPTSRFLRLNPDGLCNTLRAGTGGERGAFTSPRPIHPFLPRVISVREAARLHSYPDWFRFHVTKWNGFRQIGNSVPPLLGRAIGTSIREALNVKIERPVTLEPFADEALLSLSMKEAAQRMNADLDSMPKSRRISRVDMREALAS